MGFQERLSVSEEEQFINLFGLERYRVVLLTQSGMRTELYEELEKLYKECPNRFKEQITRKLLLAEMYVEDIVGEVFDKKIVDDKIIIFVKREIIKELLDELTDNSDGIYFRRENLKEELTKVRDRELKDFDNATSEKIAKMLQSTLGSELVKKLINSIAKDMSWQGKHSRLNLQGTIIQGMIGKMTIIQKLIADYIIIHRDNSNIGEYILYLQNSRIQDKSIEEINELAIKFHVQYIKKRFPGISDEEIFAKIYDNYETKGFLFRGINGMFLNNEIQNGVKGAFSKEGLASMRKIDNLFKTHGVKNVLLSKLSEAQTGLGYYYLTDNFGIAEFYSFHNPEFMSTMFGAGPYFADENEFSLCSFYLRDKEECIGNVRKLCDRYGFSEEEIAEIMTINSKALDSIPNFDYNGILMIPKSVVKRSVQTEQGNESLKEKLFRLLDFRRTNNYRCHIDIPPKAISAIRVPSFQRIFEGEEGLFKRRCRKFIEIERKKGDREPLYYDIFIRSADENDLDCIVFEEDKRTPIKEKLNTSDYPLTVDVFKFDSKALNEFDILECDNKVAQPSFQSLMMMIAVNGVSNSEVGEELLSIARETFTPTKMSQYYYYVSKKLMEIANYKEYPSSIRLIAAKRIIEDLLPKAIYMGQTNRYPTDIRYRNLIQTQYDAYNGQLIRDKIRGLQENSNDRISIILSNGLDGLMHEVEEVFNQHYSFDSDYETMCKSWFEKLGFEEKFKEKVKEKAEEQSSSL